MTLEERLNRIVAQREEVQNFSLLFGFDATQRFTCSWERMGLDVGGHIDFSECRRYLEASPRFIFREDVTGERTEKRSRGEKATPADPIVHETDELNGYLTVHHQNGNYEWSEYNFRVRDDVAYLGCKMKLSNPHNGRGWIPPEVVDAIQEYHPALEVSGAPPPWWG